MSSQPATSARSLRNDQERYGRVSIVFHWTTAILMIVIVALGLSLDSLQRGTSTRDAVMMAHKSFGLIILLLAAVRISWLFRSPAPNAAYGLASWEKLLSWTVHKLLYLLLLALPLSGILLSEAAGKEVSLFGLVSLPQFIPVSPSVPLGERPLVILGGLLHTVVFKSALFVAFALHIGGVLKHLLIDRRPESFRRMWGW